MSHESPPSAQRLSPPVTMTRTIRSPAEEIWATISAPGNLEWCHPFCAGNRVVTWPGPDSVDEIRYLSGWVYERRFVNWFDGVGYDLEIGGVGEPRSFVSWRIAPVDGATSTLTITVHPHPLGSLPAVIRWLPYAACVRPLLRRYLSSVVQGVEWYVTKGEAVPRNQFGRHPWFSAKRPDHD